MTHNHVSEYQLRVIHSDGTEELSGWMKDMEEVAQAISGMRRLLGRIVWLQERTVCCPDCFDREQVVVECPISDAASPRCRPHDSRYLLAVGSRSKYEVFVAVGSRR